MLHAEGVNMLIYLITVGTLFFYARLTTGRRMKYNDWLLADKHLYNEAGTKEIYEIGGNKLWKIS